MSTRSAATRKVFRVAAQAFGAAMRRPSTYPGLAREVLWTAAHLLAYPAGIARQASELRTDDGAHTHGWLRHIAPEIANVPIVLIHGYGHNRTAFLVLKRRLRRYGFAYVTTWNYGIVGADVPRLAGDLARHVDRVRYAFGAQRVHVVGHSLGGLIARYYIQELGGKKRVDTCVTIATPHRGSMGALFGRNRIAEQLRPGSELLTLLNGKAQPAGVRFVALYSNLDGMIFPASNAKIVGPGWRATNVLIKDHGHLSMPSARASIAAVLDALTIGTVTILPSDARAAS